MLSIGHNLQVIILLIVLVMRKRIALVMQLFHEAGKAVYTMPVLLLQPVYVRKYLIKLTYTEWGNISAHSKNFSLFSINKLIAYQII